MSRSGIGWFFLAFKLNYKLQEYRCKNIQKRIIIPMKRTRITTNGAGVCVYFSDFPYLLFLCHVDRESFSLSLSSFLWLFLYFLSPFASIFLSLSRNYNFPSFIHRFNFVLRLHSFSLHIISLPFVVLLLLFHFHPLPIHLPPTQHMHALAHTHSQLDDHIILLFCFRKCFTSVHCWEGWRRKGRSGMRMMWDRGSKWERKRIQDFAINNLICLKSFVAHHFGSSKTKPTIMELRRRK